MGLAVRGTCPKCQRVYDTEAPERRSTRRFTCVTDGCDGNVIARRVKGNDPAPPPATPEPGTAGRRRKKALRVDGYARQPRHPEPEAAPELPRPPAEPGPEAPVPPPGRPADIEPVSEPRDGDGERPQPRRRAERERGAGVTPYDDLY